MLEKYQKEFAANDVVYLKIKARPGAAETHVRGILESDEGEVLKIDIAAPPEQGRANEALKKYLASVFMVIKGQIDIVSGAGDKYKLIKIHK